MLYLAVTEAKDVRIQLDSQDLLNIIKGLISKDVPVHRSNKLDFQYRNPFHPEDGTVADLLNESQMLTNLKRYKAENESNKYIEDVSEQKLESENKMFLNDPNKISDDELTENNSIENNTNNFNKTDVKKM